MKLVFLTITSKIFLHTRIFIQQKPTKSPSEDFRIPNPYDDRATAYNPEVQHREELIRLHESARRKQSVPMDTSSNPADAAATDNHRGAMKRKPISATPLNMRETLSFRYSVIPKSPEEAKFLLEALDDNFVFDVLDDKTKRRLVDVMVVESFEEGEWVMHQVRFRAHIYWMYAYCESSLRNSKKSHTH